MRSFFSNRLPAWKSITGGAKAVAALAVLLLLCPSLFAQITGTLTGTVTDQSDAVVPGAKVTLLNQQSQDTRETTSNNVGHFAFPAVDPGTYTLKIDAGSFAPWMHQGIVMNPGDTRNIADIKLQIGNSTNQVTVQAEADEVRPVDSGERSAVLTSKDINQLALQGRNLSELLKILPGVTSASKGINNGTVDFLNAGAEGSAVGNGLNANGVPNRGGTSITSDGANIIDPGCNCYSIASINPDMTQEVKVQTANFGADSAKGPVVVNNISKSGGAQYHVEGYLYARHHALNANDWQTNHLTPIKPAEDHYYYPGGNVGGPVPFTKKKVLFWFGYEHFYQNTGNSSVLKSFIPSVGMMQGNFTPGGEGNAALCPGGFSATATNWCNNLNGTVLPDGSTVTNGIIPAQFLDPGAAALAKIWPKPNADPNAAGSGGFNYIQALPGIHNGYIYRTRVDYNLSENTKIYVSYQKGEDSQPAQGNGAHIWWTPSNAIPFPGGGIQSPSHSKTLTGHFLHVFTPTLTDEFIASWGYGNNPLGSSTFAAATRSALGYPAGYGTVYKTGVKMIPSYDGGSSQNFPDFSQADIFENGGQFQLRKEIPAFADNLTKVWRSHTFKVGAYTENTRNYQGSYEFPNGHITSFAGQNPNVFTHSLMGSPNNPTANFLMGVATGYQENSAAPYTDLAYKTFSGYVEDSWKTTKRLTLELGVRFDHISHWRDRKNLGMAAFFPNLVAPDLAADNAAPTGTPFIPGVRWHGMDANIPNSGSPDRTAYVSPRLGLAWDLFGTGNTVLRGGWGAYRFNDQYNDFTNALSTSQGVQSFNLPSKSSVFLSQIGQLSPQTAKWSPSNVNAVDPNDSEIPVTYAYNFTLSQQLPWRSLFEMAYVGNNSEKLLMGGGSGAAVGSGDFTNRNKMPLGALFKADPVTGIRAPNPEDVTRDLQGNPLPNSYADYAPFGSAYGNDSISVPEHVGYANYNGLQTSWAKQAGRLSFNLNYTWSKTLGTGFNLDPFSVRGNYGPAAIDRTHVLNTSYTYNLPDLVHGSKFLGGATNGWTISGITTRQSGGNLQAIYNSQNFGLNLSYANVPKGPGGSPGPITSSLGAPTYFGTTAQVAIVPALTCDPTSNLGALQTAQLGCFTAPAIGSNGPRNYPYLRGAAFFDSDLSIYKTFHITERHNVQFRASAFNFLNHPLPQFTGNSQLQLQYVVDYNTHAVSLNSAVPKNWGYLDNKAGAPSQRIMELALKYSF